MSTATKLNKLLETKEAIKQAIIDKGVEVSNTDTFASYASKIESISSGGSDKLTQVVSRTVTEITAGDLAGITVIGNYAFYGCSSLTSIVIPDSVTEIGGFAFDNCSSLTSIVIPDGVTEIGNYAFYGCSSLTSIDFSTNESVPKLSSYNAFNVTPSTLKILVPTALYYGWITASNWRVIASKIYGVDADGNIVNSSE